VAAARAGGSFFRILPDGSYTTLFQDYVSRDFAVAPDGTVCYIGEGFGCRAADGSLIDPSFSTTQSIEFGTDGAAYTTDTANVYRWEAGTAITLLNQNTLPGTLSIEARSPIVRYAYNARDELTGVSGGRSESYAYDPAGNRTQDHRAGDYVYNNLNQLISGNGNTYSYDANGNRVTKTNSAGTTRYQYDAENRLTRIDLPDGTQAHYAYDPFGRRIQKRIVDSQGQETLRRYVYDREDILFELDQNNQLVSEFLHGPGIDEPLLLARNNQIYTYHRDALGSIIAITDQSNTIVQRYTYDAYGNLTTSNPDFRQPYAYTGREYDEESGLYYYRARYYDSEVGRFITRDPIGLRGGHNLYAYVRNNPMRFADPSGLSTIEYNSTSGSLYVFDSQGFPTGGSPYSASNNAASNSAGSWPSGTHPYSYYVPHVGDGPNDTFGSNGNFVFNVPNRTGMGVHSGMRDSCDLAGRCGYEYATEGCIRTTDEATEEIKRLHEGGDPLKEIRVTP
jgi:RHS repeat-associated protein